MFFPPNPNNFLTIFSPLLNALKNNIATSGASVAISFAVIINITNTPNCIDGSHTWISSNGKIIDTTLMLIIDEDFSSEIGYKEENRYNPNLDPIYVATKEWTNDITLKTNEGIKR